MEVQRKYVYDGPVEAFGRYISRMWSGTTTAPTAEKARANLIFQFKKQHNMDPHTKIELVGKIYQVDERRKPR